jgi:DNA-binding NtrC family response regulator
VTRSPLSTRVLTGPAPRLVLEQAELRVVSGPDRGTRVPLGIDSVTIGSGAECDLVLHDETVSARHAEVSLGAGGYLIRDLGSKNGLLLGDWPVDRAPLVDGMRLKLGGSALLVKALGSSAEIELGQPRAMGQLVAHSLKMRAVVAALERLAPAEITVLLEGETGSGKEVAAQALHAASPRRGGPFTVFDCGAHPAGLIASALFGHERGAFTGADAARPGALEEAHGGTLFLDEVGELPLDLQPMLLRALDAREARRVGGKLFSFDVRVVAATHRNLAEEVRAGRFRQDLYFRLAASRLRIPPLRERRDDIPILAHGFAQEVDASLGPELLALLSAYDWPGNVRELRNTVARAAISPDPAFVAPQRARAGLPPLPEARRQAADDFERDYVDRALRLAGGSVSRAAELAGVSRQMMTRLVARHRRPAGDGSGSA